MAKDNVEHLDLALKSKDLEKKLEYCTKYLELNPNDMDVWNYKGTVLSELGRHKKAIECHAKATEFIDDPSYLLGAVELNLGDYEEAVKLFDDVLRKKPDYARAWVDKGSALVNLRRPKEAIVCLDKALKLELSKVYEGKAWLERGRALIDLRRLEEAIICLNNSLEIDPGNDKALCLKGSILLLDEMRKYEEALTCFNEVLEILEINPDNEMAKLAKNGKEIAEQKFKEEAKSKAKEEKTEKRKEMPTKKGFFKKLFG